MDSASVPLVGQRAAGGDVDPATSRADGLVIEKRIAEGAEVPTSTAWGEVRPDDRLLRWHSRLIKRGTDLVLATIGLICSAPVIAISALLIKRMDPGPAFFRQRREGRGGTVIEVWKLRTMVVAAELRLAHLIESDPEVRRSWQLRFKLTSDPRVIPRIGTCLRRSSIDELPQLWNVLRGEMSLVGPRPLPLYHLAQFHPDLLELRRRVRPGITGLWQVRARGRGDVREQQEYDAHYIRNWSLWMDAYVLAKTVAVVISGRGAH